LVRRREAILTRLSRLLGPRSTETRKSDLPFSRNLRRLLKERKVSLNEICAISGVAKSVAHGWVNGAIPRDLHAVARLSDALEIGFRELLLSEKETLGSSHGDANRSLSEKEIFDHLCEVLIQRMKKKEI
jgi:transcriptional regulator with XRE-family HTH domain